MRISNETYPPHEVAPRKKSRLNQLAVVAMSLATATLLTSSTRTASPCTEIEIPSNIKVVGMGDSITAGPDKTIDFGDYNNCFRAGNSYLYRIFPQNPDTIDNVSCFGASLDDIRHGRFEEPSQLDALDDSVDFVFLTAGANYVNLYELLEACNYSVCNPENPVVRNAIDRFKSDDLTHDLKALYLEISNRAKNAKIFVVPYPEIIKRQLIPFTQFIYDKDTQLVIASYVDALNQSIEQAIDSLDGKYPIYMAPQATDTDLFSNFGGTFFTDPSQPRILIHPTTNGAEKIGRSVHKGVTQALSNQCSAEIS